MSDPTQEEDKRVLGDLLAASAASVTIHDADGRFLVANQRTLDIHGYTREEFLRLRIHDLDVPDSEALFAERVRKIQTEGEAAFDVVHRRKDGSELPLHISARATRWGGRDVVLSLAYDLTETRRAEARTREIVQRLDVIGRQIPGAVYQFARRPDGSFVVPFMSPSAERLFERPMAELTNPQQLFDNVHPDDSAGLWASIEDSARTLEPWRHEFRIRRARGDVLWLLGESLPTSHADGTVSWNGLLLDVTARRTAEDALRLSDARLRVFLDSTTDLAFMKDEGHVYRMVNNATARFFGRPAEEILGRSDFDLMPADAAEWCLLGDRNALQRGTPSTQVEEVNGRVFESCKFPIPLEGGRRGIGATIRDITESKRLEDALTSSEGRLRKVFEILPVGLWFADREGRLIGGNAEGIRIWGAEPNVPMEEYGVFKARRLPSGREIASDDWALAHTIRDGTTTVNEELEIDAFDGRQRTILNYTAPVLDGAGKVDGAVVVNLDITERKRIEMERRRLLERFDLAARAAEFGIWDWDIVTDVLIWDERMRLLYGIAKADFTSAYDAWTPRLHPEDAARAQAAVQRALAGDGEFDIEFRVIRPDGTVRHLKGLAEVTRDASGKPLRMIGVNYDITVRKESEARLTAQLDELRRWHDATLGREMRVLQLKQEVNDLLAKAGQPRRYDSSERK